MKTYEGAATLHPQLSKIKVRSLSGWTIATQQRMTSYLLVAPRFKICHLQSTMWRLSQGRGLHVVLADLSMACLAECGENSAKKGGSQNTPLKMYPRGREAQHHHFRVPRLRSCTNPIYACTHFCSGTGRYDVLHVGPAHLKLRAATWLCDTVIFHV